jgi:hypothetical protein
MDMSVVPPDILFVIFEQLLDDPSGLYNCMFVCKLWRSIILGSPNTFLRTSRMFRHVLVSQPESLKKAYNAAVWAVLRETNFHRILTNNVLLRISPLGMVRDLFTYIPNPMLNHRTIAAATATRAKFLAKRCYSLFFKNLAELSDAAYEISAFRSEPMILRIYQEWYEPSLILGVDAEKNPCKNHKPGDQPAMILNKLIWIYILINTDLNSTLLDRFPYSPPEE